MVQPFWKTVCQFLDRLNIELPCAVLSPSVVSSYLRPRGLQPTRLCPRGFSRQEYWSGSPCPSPGNLPKPGIEPRSPTLQADSLLSELPGKPKNAGVGSLSLLQGIFLTQESNQGPLHCRQILYQLSYQRSPELPYDPAIPLQEMKTCVHIKTCTQKFTAALVTIAK